MKTLADVNILWCRHGSAAARVKESLKMNLQKSIDDVNNLKHLLTDITPGPTGATIIRSQRPGKDFTYECITCIDRER
jgi:phosphopantetheine adenylyltransferase